MARDKLFRHKIVVRGFGSFPYDMLRYDACYPDTTTDSYAMESGARERRDATLIHIDHRHWTPTHDRWSSFCWVVTDHTMEEY